MSELDNEIQDAEDNWNENVNQALEGQVMQAPKVEPDELMTQEMFTRVLPKKIKTKVTPEMVSDINSLLIDPTLRENFRDNLLSYTGVMADGKYKIQGYIDAVKYVSCKLLGASNVEAYTKTFPHRFQRLVNEGADDKTISSYVAGYNKTQLVNLILEQTLVPMHVLNQDLYQKALNKQAHLMATAKSEKVQTDAANSLLTHLKMPETQKIELDIGMKGDKSIDELRATTLALAAQQKKMIESGVMQVKEVAHSKLVTVDNSDE